jgi:hypothetical protein
MRKAPTGRQRIPQVIARAKVTAPAVETLTAFADNLNQNSPQKKIIEMIESIHNQLERLIADVKDRTDAIHARANFIAEQNNLPRPDNTAQAQSIADDLQTLARSPKITRLETYQDYIIAYTAPLEYTGVASTDRDSENYSEPLDFTLGSYAIALKIGQYPSAINLTQTANSFNHPCIRGCGDICAGSQVQEQMRLLSNEKSYSALVLLTIALLERPDYNQPYIQANDWIENAEPRPEPLTAEQIVNIINN